MSGQAQLETVASHVEMKDALTSAEEKWQENVKKYVSTGLPVSD